MKRVKCIDAKEVGIPIVEGQIYTVRSSFSQVPDWGGPSIAGYLLQDVVGQFRADRFEEVSE